MGERTNHIPERMINFIRDQKIFFVATAAPSGRVNLSPKGMASLKVIDKNRAVWLNLTGSGNETAAHIQESARMTLMFCSFQGKPLILRLYGEAREIQRGDSGWDELYSLFEPIEGARQVFDLSIDLVHSSCGFGVPCFDYVGEREELVKWAEKKGEAGLIKYRRDNNSRSIDGRDIEIREG